MRLIDLAPRWLTLEGRRVGFIFRCPTDAKFYQTCFFAPTPRRQQDAAIEALLGDDYHQVVQQCKESVGWTPTGAVDALSFETLTVTPSLDGSPGGLWHGFITNGQIVGGL